MYQTEQFSPTGGLAAVSISSNHWVSGATSRILHDDVTHGYQCLTEDKRDLFYTENVMFMDSKNYVFLTDWEVRTAFHQMVNGQTLSQDLQMCGIRTIKHSPQLKQNWNTTDQTPTIKKRARVLVKNFHVANVIKSFQVGKNSLDI